MRRLVSLVAVVFVTALCTPVFAAEMAPEQQKDECLLRSKQCANEVDTLQEQMRKLDAEIKKGTRVYTPQELEKLQMKLKEANDILYRLTTGAGGS